MIKRLCLAMVIALACGTAAECSQNIMVVKGCNCGKKQQDPTQKGKKKVQRKVPQGPTRRVK